MRRYALRFVAVAYVAVILIGPLSMVVWRAFNNGAAHLWHTLSDPNTVHAFELTAKVTAIAVPVNAVFGVVCALAVRAAM